MDPELFSLYWWLSVVAVGLLINLASAYIKPALDALLRFVSSRNLNRQLRQAEWQRAHLAELAHSDRAILLLAFQGLFALLGIAALLFAVEALLRQQDMILDVAVAVLWLVVAVVAIYLTKLLKKVAQYPKSSEEIEKHIAELRRRLPSVRE